MVATTRVAGRAAAGVGVDSSSWSCAAVSNLRKRAVVGRGGLGGLGGLVRGSIADG